MYMTKTTLADSLRKYKLNGYLIIKKCINNMNIIIFFPPDT